MTTYLLDANTFINSHQCQYAMEVCPGFWHWLESMNKSSRLFSIDRISDELQKCDDVLCTWAKTQGDGFFLPFDDLAAACLSDVTTWIESQQRFRRSAKDLFNAGADLFLIAYAKARSYTLVTQEVPAPESKTKVKIPDVCDGVGVGYISLWELLKVEKARFVAAS